MAAKTGFSHTAENSCKNRIHRYVEENEGTRFVVLNALCADLVQHFEDAHRVFLDVGFDSDQLSPFGGPAVAYVALLQYAQNNSKVAHNLAQLAFQLDPSSRFVELLSWYEPQSDDSVLNERWCPELVLDSMMRRVDMVKLLSTQTELLDSAMLVVTGCSKATHMNLWELLDFKIKALLLLDEDDEILQAAVAKIISNTKARLPVPLFVATQKLPFVDSLVSLPSSAKAFVIAAFSLGRLPKNQCLESLKFAKRKGMTVLLLDFDVYTASRASGEEMSSPKLVADMMDAIEQGLQGESSEGIGRFTLEQGCEVVQWVLNMLSDVDQFGTPFEKRNWDELLDQAGYSNRVSILGESTLYDSEHHPKWWTNIRFELCHAD